MSVHAKVPDSSERKFAVDESTSAPGAPVPSAFVAPSRVLMGPGPSEVPASVLEALAKPTLGHLDPAFLAMLDELRSMLRGAFGTTHELTLPMSGTGSFGMETCLVNLIEPGDRVLVGVNGVFGERICEVAKRAGAEVTASSSPWGRALDVDAMRKAAQGRSYKLVCMVHAETSTGALTPIAPVRKLADELGALLLVDAVTSLGGLAVDVDASGVDAVYSGTQKCLSCPPGLSPVSFSERARATLLARKHPVQSWYADLTLITRYWGGERAYHHTAPTNMLCALHEALRLVHAEGLEKRFARHALHARALWAGLEALGLTLPVPLEERLAPLTLVNVPQGLDEPAVRRALLQDYGLEIGGGLGAFKGKAFRIGLMGASCSRKHVMLCLAALSDVLRRAGHTGNDDPLAAASSLYFA
jgi:alanine-glyoxylate transaminase/serine-glyoxylate transaminase/serine-pyruvate transaminase